ncbi:MAG: extradiol dioxygenase family protein [Halieaceae bacterium]|jgi:extradiol dioxygenase family protein
MVSLTPFHIAVQVRNIAEARVFYGQRMGLPEGRSSENWIDFNMYGHQFVVHLNAALGAEGSISQISNSVDGHGVPVPHCGVVLEFPDWEVLADQMRIAGQVFVIEPYIRFAGELGEQATMFFCDPSGNALEFKAFRDINASLFSM